MCRLLGFFLAFSTASGAAYKIETVAGSDWTPENSQAASAVLLQTEGIAADANGNLYVSDAANHRVHKISRSGAITTVAGTGYSGFSGDSGPAAAAQLNSPYGLAFDGLGNLYIADLGNARVRRIGRDGTIITVAGGGSLPAGGANEGGQATGVSLSAPRNVAWDGRGSLYVSDFNAHRVYRLAPDGSLTTAAGTGIPGLSGDGGLATKAQVAYPTAVSVDRSGSLYLADSQNHLIRKVANGLISSIAHAVMPTGLTFDSFGNLYVADPGSGQVLTLPVAGPPAAFPISAHDLAVAPDGYVYAATGSQVLRVLFYGTSVVVAGGGSSSSGDGGPATLAHLNHPSGVAADAQGNLYIADRDNHRIRRVAPDGTITTIAGTGTAGNTGDGGQATQALLNGPESVTIDARGSLFIADTGNHRVRVIPPDGVIFPFLAPGLVSPVHAIADGKGTFYVADAGAGTIVEVSSAGVPSTLVANLNDPGGLALDGSGNLYFTESGSAHVWRLGPNGDLTALAEGFWSAPRGVSVGDSGDVFVADAGRQRILHVDSSGNLSPAAGTGVAGFGGDGSDGLSAQLGFPSDICTGPGGVLYIADLENNRIRRLTPEPAGISAPLLTITAVNAATRQPGPIAPGMLLDLLGTGLAAADAPNIQILFNGIPAPVLALDNSSLIVQVPPQLEGQRTAQIQVMLKGNLLAEIPVGLASAAPGLFSDASGQALANNQDATLNSTANPAARGSVVALYGTGQGVEGLPVSITIGGYGADVLYSGPVAGYPGLFQINARVPVGYVAPGNLSVIVTVGPTPSQTGVAIAVN